MPAPAIPSTPDCPRKYSYIIQIGSPQEGLLYSEHAAHTVLSDYRMFMPATSSVADWRAVMAPS